MTTNAIVYVMSPSPSSGKKAMGSDGIDYIAFAEEEVPEEENQGDQEVIEPTSKSNASFHVA